MRVETDARRISRGKRLAFAAVAITLALGLPVLSLLAIDVYLHGKYERSAGVNVWGYRGPILHGKRNGETRIAALGGSTTFGYGVTWDQSFPAVLERDLAAATNRPISVANLGYNNEGAYAARFTLQDYAYLQYDIVILFDGYNDMSQDSNIPNVSVFRHDSPIFRLTGYLPIFPLIFREKAAAMLHGGDANALYHDTGKTVFHPALATRTAAEAIRAAAAVGDSLERQLGRVSAEPSRQIAGGDTTGCGEWWAFCASVRTSIEYALSQNKQVVVVTPPFEVGKVPRSRNIAQQTAMAVMVKRLFGSNPRVQYVNLGSAVDLADPALSFDRMHFTVEGNRRVAAALVAPVLDAMNRQEHAAR